jgi:hypothetical protein
MYVQESEGGSAQDQVLARLFAKLDAADNAAGLTLDSDEDLDKAATARAERLDKSFGGSSMYDDIRGDITKMRGDNEGSLQEGKGLAALQAAGAMLQGNDAIRGIGAAGSAFATSYAPALAAKRKADQSLTEMNINLTKARRAEKMGLSKDATTYEQNAQVNKINAFKANKQAQQLGIDALARTATAVRPVADRAEARPSDMSIYAASDPDEQARFDRFLEKKGAGLAGVTAAVAGRENVAETTDMRARDEAAGRAGNDAVKLLQNRADYREAKDNDKRNGTNTAKAMETATRDAAEAAFYRSAPKAKGGDGTSTSKQKVIKLD